MKTASRLFTTFRPDSYDLKLNIDSEKLTFSGVVIISGVKSGPPSKRITLHQKDLKIISVKICKIEKSGEREIVVARINSHQSFDELRLHSEELLYGGKYKVEIEFSGKITDSMHGMYPCYFDNRKKKLIATQFESHHAREVFPCIDEPEAKATFDLTLETPNAGDVIANTPIRSQKKESGITITSFVTSPKMSTYLLAFVYGEISCNETKTKNGVLVRAYSTPKNKKQTSFALETSTKVVDFFEDYFGVKYPLPKLDLISLPDFSSGAMENWGLITFRESIFLYDPKNTSIETKQTVALVIAHEIAHQWFGNLVTMKWWNDLWLNESFANLMEYVAIDALFPEWKVWEQFVNYETNQALRRDSLPNVQSVRTKVNHPDELATLFDPSIVYAKGGNILNMLRNYVGEDKFRRGLKLYFDKYAFKNTEADDLWECISQSSGINISSFMENWLTKPGFPRVDVDYEPGESVFTASQQRLVLNDHSEIGSIWQIPLGISSNHKDLLLVKKTSTIECNKNETLLLNHLGRSYFVPNYINKNHKINIMESVKNGHVETIDRICLVNNQSLLEKNLMTTNSESLELSSTLADEREEPVWSALTGIFSDAKRLIVGNKADEQNYNTFVKHMVLRLVKFVGWDAKKSENSHMLKLRGIALGLAASSEDEKIIEEGLKRFRTFSKPSDISSDIRDTVYFIGIRFGDKHDFEKLIKLYKQLDNADERNEVAGALCSTKNSKQINQLLSMIKTNFVRNQDVMGWYIALLRNQYGRKIAWEWLTKNWDWIEENFGSDKSYDGFARYSASVFSTKSELTQYKKFFMPKLNELSLNRAISLGIEELEGRLAWRDKNEVGTKEWLKNFAKSL